MKTTRLSLTIAALFFASATLITSCKKKVETQDVDSDTSEASDHTFAENMSNDIVTISSQATDYSSGALNSGKTAASEDALSYCATVKRDTIAKIDTVIFSNSTCMDGRTRNGMLIFNYSSSAAGAKHYRDPGFKCVVTSQGYSVEGKSINIINKTISNITPSGFDQNNTNLIWSITGHIQVTRSNGTHDFSYTRIKILLNTADANVYHGAATAISWDKARIGITGEGSGTTVNGRSYTANITNQLIRDFGGCTIGNRHPFIQGTLEFTPAGKPARTLDYGSGTCDLNATVTIKGKTFDIVLP